MWQRQDKLNGKQFASVCEVCPKTLRSLLSAKGNEGILSNLISEVSDHTDCYAIYIFIEEMIDALVLNKPRSHREMCLSRPFTEW